MSFEQYDNSIKSQLTDEDCYTPPTHNPMTEYKAAIDQVLESGFSRGWITDKEKEFLSVKHPICAMFYGLPKIHESLNNPPL